MRALPALVAVLALVLAAQVSAFEPQGDTGAHDPTLLIDGKRWFVFTTGKGLQRLESTDEGVFVEVLRDLRVRRGEEPRMLRESLPLVIPADAQRIEE